MERIHQYGENPRILNDSFRNQYHQFISLLCFKPVLSAEDNLYMAYYLTLMKRMAPALNLFEKYIQQSQTTGNPMIEYFKTYLHLSLGDVEQAKQIAQVHANSPIHNIRFRFEKVLAQIKEAEKSVFVLPNVHTAFFDFSINGKVIELNHKNVNHVQINYYLVDIEWIFSANPFLYSGELNSQRLKQFSYAMPKSSKVVDISSLPSPTSLEIEKEFQSSNTIIEFITNTGISRSHPYFSHSMIVHIADTVGQLQVLDKVSSIPLPKTYVKTYAMKESGHHTFHKDGYTDFRGIFTFASKEKFNKVCKFAILIVSESNGSVIRMASPFKC